MGHESFPDVEPTGSVGEPARRSGGLRSGLAALFASAAITFAFVAAAEEPAPPVFPSETCQEKEDRAECARYCDCHIFELRRDISDQQLEQMLLTAERGGKNAEAIREWLVQSAKVCEKRVFGEKKKPAAEPTS